MLESLKSQRTRLCRKIQAEVAGADVVFDRGADEESLADDVLLNIKVFMSLMREFKDHFEMLSQKIAEGSERRTDEQLDEEADFVIEIVTGISRANSKLSAVLSRTNCQRRSSETAPQRSDAMTSLQEKIDKLI